MNFVIIGAGAAGIAAARELRILDSESRITMISTDTHIHSRCMLHKFLSGERDESGLDFTEDDFLSRYRIEWARGRTVSSIDTDFHTVETDDGTIFPYTALLIASGAESIIPPVGQLRTAANVFGLRHLSDAQAIRTAAESAEHVAVIGSGLVGLDAAYGLLELKKKITVIEMADRILPLQLDAHGALEYQMRFEHAGVSFELGKKVCDTVCGQNGMITALLLDDGRKIPCDFVIAATGVRPAIACLNDTDIRVDRGIAVNEFMETSGKDVYAAGDVTGLAGIWPNAAKMGRTAARNMCGLQTKYEDRFALKNTINFFGLVSLCVGRIEAGEGDVVEVREDQRVYQRAVLRDSRLAGMLLQGDISHGGIWQYLIKREVDLGKIQKPVFEITFADFYGVGERGKFVWRE